MKTKFLELMKNKKLVAIIAACLLVVIFAVVIICCVVHNKKEEATSNTTVAVSETTTVTETTSETTTETTTSIETTSEVITKSKTTKSATTKAPTSKGKNENTPKTASKNSKPAQFYVMPSVNEIGKENNRTGSAYVKSGEAVNIRENGDGTTSFEIQISLQRSSSYNEDDYLNPQGTKCKIEIFEKGNETAIAEYTVDTEKFPAEGSTTVTSKTITIPSDKTYWVSISSN